MNEASLFEVEHGADLTVLRIHAPPSGLTLTDAKAMDQLWRILEAVAFRKPKVLLALVDAGLLSSERVEQAWQEILRQRESGSKLPPQIYAVRSNLRRLLEYFKSSQTLCISAVQGPVDFDLLGLMAVCHYRVCAEETVFENHVIERPAPPGSAMVWFLSRLIGVAETWDILLEGRSLTAEQARSQKLVNAVLPKETFEAEAIALAKGVAAKPRQALASLVVAFNHVYMPLESYLQEVGVGFEKIYGEA